MANNGEGTFRVLHTPYVPVCDDSGRSLSRIAPYPPMINPCRLCPARCCHTNVRASLPDVVHFCETLHVPFFSGFTIEQSTDEVRGVRLDRDPRLVDPEDGWPGFGEIRLRRRQGGGCVGLTEVFGYIRCGVYSARPMNCRLYPVSWEDDEGRGGPDAVLCPVPYAVTPQEAKTVEANALQAREYWAVHEAVVAEWNAAAVPDRSLRRALGFLLTKTAERLGRTLSEVVLVNGGPNERLTEALRERGMIPSGPNANRPSEVFAGLAVTDRPR